MSTPDPATEPLTNAAHRKYVGPPEKYDLATAGQFALLAALGLRETHSLLDVGCGSLRAGRLLMPYLLPGNYYGIDPNQWLIDDGIKTEVGPSLVELKRPTFSNDADFTLTTFGRTFDFMVANSIFSHATAAQVNRCFAEAAKALAPTGIFAATYFAGDHDYDGTEWVYPGRVFFRPDTFARWAADAGLTLTTLNWTHTHEQTWVALTHPAHAASLPAIHDANRLGVLEQQLKAAKGQAAALKGLHGMGLLRRVNRTLFGKRIPRDGQ